MTLAEACEILTAFCHCDADWGIAFDGSGLPHAFGIHWKGRCGFVGIRLDADDAIKLATGYEAVRSGEIQAGDSI